MPATPITNPATGESLVGTEPQLLQQVDPGWRRRLNLFTGRALSTTALDSEQIYRGSLLGTLGQSVSAGTVNGLALSLQASGADPTLVVTPGYGISANGVDVVLNRAMKTRLSTLTVLTPLPVPQTEQVVNLEQAGPPETQLTMSQHMNDPDNKAFAGILLLQPVVAQVSGRLLDTGSAPLIVSGNLGASCTQDPAEYAFEDWQVADAVQLVYVPWPSGVPALPLPAQSPVATWRNRLAYAIFEAESLLGPDDQLPWSMLGVPVGLIAFDAGAPWAASTAFGVGQFVMDSNGNRQSVVTAGSTGATAPAWNTTYGGSTTDGGVTWQNNGLGWNPLFVDCSAVVRAGGLPRRRLVLPSQAPPLEVWQSNTNFAAGQFIIDGNDNVQQVKTAGSSGGPPPTWNAAFGQTTADGSVVWVNNGAASWRANTKFAAGQFIYDSQGYLQYVATAGTTGASEPDWGSVFLQTSDGSVTWVNNGAGAQPLIQPALAQARINQLSEQLSQTLVQQTQFNTLADIFPTLPPSGILPAAALNFTNHTAPWLPPNWTVTAAPVLLEELETVLETGMMEALLNTSATAPSNVALMEPVEVLVPLPDAVYDPNILVVPTVAPIFQQEVNTALNARNLILQRMQTVQEEMNVLYTSLGPNLPVNGNVIDPDAGLTPQELAGRDTFPPYLPAANETFGTVLPATWKASTSYAPGAFIVDDNGAIQVMQNTAAASSGAADPAWNTSVAGVTADGAVNWLNNGPWSWQPNTVYAIGQFVVDAGGFRHNVTVAGTSAAQPPTWGDALGTTTPDGVLWQAGGQAIWQPDIPYAVGALILDRTGNVQSVQTGGISGDSPPPWNSNVGQTTQDSGVTWVNLGAAKWTASTSYSAGQAILDSNQQIQAVQIGGTSGTTQPAWNEGANATTLDSAITWNNAGPLTWQANTQYSAGTLIIDSNNSLQSAKTAGTAGATAPAWSTTPGGTTTDNTVTWSLASFASTDMAQLINVANQAPYTTQYLDSTSTSQTLKLLTASDLAMLASGGNGLQSLITSLNARISAANDLLDTAFLTSQTDIYRYRQNVLGATAASTLATSPILANIAMGETAAATAADLQSYINNLPPTNVVAATPAVSTTTSTQSPTSAPAPAPAPPPASSGFLLTRIAAKPLASPFLAGAATQVKSSPSPPPAQVVQESLVSSQPALAFSNAATLAKTSTLLKAPTFLGTTDLNAISKAPTLNFGPATIASPTPVVSQTDITSQSPLTGAQLNIRTLTIAQRLQQSPSQEAMFYSIANRLSFLQTLQALCTDLNLAVDDLSILVDDNSPPPPTTTPTASAPAPAPAPVPVGTPVAVQVKSYTMHDWFNTSMQVLTIIPSIQSPYIVSDASEATLFSVGVRVSEQHVMLLRALEARVQQYADFVSLCNTALGSMQSDIRQGQTYLTQQANNLMQQRQNVAFTTALLADEQARVTNLAAQRQQVLASSVQLVVYTRARTLEATDTAPSRQLVPANISNPVPACLQQSVSIPPELREIVAQLREAPVNWLPSAALQMNKLQRPSLLQQLAVSTQARASLQLQAATQPSSAAGESGAYATAISKVYVANQQVFRSLQVQRAAIQPAALTSLSWSMQLANVQSVAAVNDLISSEAVHTEVSNVVARLIQQISSVATCLYTRVSIALPVERLAWAEYLQGSGISAGLRSLAILPNWNQQTYTDRQQMQLLVDWLFQQIDTNIAAASAFMSDVVRTAILLASDVPIDNLIPGNIIARTRPALGGIVSLNLPSDRVSSGMYVHLYSGATLAARAVVTDLDSSTVSATVTDVFKSDVYLETTDTAHFTAQMPQAVALRPLFS
jgi:hypothetical protein